MTFHLYHVHVAKVPCSPRPRHTASPLFGGLAETSPSQELDRAADSPVNPLNSPAGAKSRRRLSDGLSLMSEYENETSKPAFSQEQVDLMVANAQRSLEEAHAASEAKLRSVLGEYTAATSHYMHFLSLRVAPSVSCSCLDTLNAPSSNLPLSPTASRCLQPV